MFPVPLALRAVAPDDLQGRMTLPFPPSDRSFITHIGAISVVFYFEIISHLLKSCKNGTKNPLVSATSIPPLLTLATFALTLFPCTWVGYELFSEVFQNKLQTWCTFTLEYFCVYFPPLRVFSYVTSEERSESELNRVSVVCSQETVFTRYQPSPQCDVCHPRCTTSESTGCLCVPLLGLSLKVMSSATASTSPFVTGGKCAQEGELSSLPSVFVSFTNVSSWLPF